MIGYYNYTVILTYLSLVFAMLGIHLSFLGYYQQAFLCLLICGICDTFDGIVARKKTNRSEEEKSFGIQIDSLCDLVAFGIFPAILGYCVGLRSYGWLVVETIYCLAAVIRLAYFNVEEENRQKKTNEKRKYYQGLPVTMAACFFPLAYCFRSIFLGLPHLYGAIMVILSVSFVVNVKVPKVGDKGLFFLGIIGLIEIVLILVL